MRIPVRKVLLSWLFFLPFPIVNGTVRNFVYAPVVGELTAHQISTVILAAVFTAYIYLLWRRDIRTLPMREAFTIGGIWVGLTVLFEFGFGHYVMGNPWTRLFHDYDLTAGRIWSLMLITELLALPGIRYGSGH